MLTQTEKRVITANMQLSKIFSDMQDEAKKQAID